MNETGSNQVRIIMITPFSLEDLCQKEAFEAGAESANIKPGKVECTGPIETAYRLCLYSRFASRILLELASFSASEKEGFYKEAMQIAWEDEIPEGSTIAIDCRIHSTRNTELTHQVFAAQLLKDAVCDRMREKTGKRPSVELRLPDIRISLTIRQTRCSVCLDFSGEPLHKRGYRKKTTAAPLKENLAAAILARAGWPKAAADGALFLDPMCGSGTFAVEAAYMAAGIAPGINRKFFGFLRWQKHQAGLWKSIREKAQLEYDTNLKKLGPMTAVEINPEAAAAAEENFRTAGLENQIRLINKDIFETTRAECFPEEKPAGSKKGFIAINPPYGERISHIREAEYTCRRLGIELPKQYGGWKMALLAGSKQLSIATGLRPYKTNPLKNGQIESVLACYDFKEQEVEEKRSEREIQGKEMFLNRLKKNRKQMKKWLKETGIGCYRIYDADLPEFSAAIDCYETLEEGLHVVVAEYAPPATIPQQTRSRRLNLMIESLPDFFHVPPSHIHLKVRKKQKGSRQYTKSRDEFQLYTVAEEGMKFNVDFDRYLDTGLFLDHRPMRKLIKNILVEKQRHRKGKPLLFMNLFSYTCTASVYAASAGAETVSVDLSNTYLEWGKKNFDSNRLSLKQHRFFREDALEFLAKEKRFFDLIYIDPPTFSNSKKTGKDFIVDQDYIRLIKGAARVLAPDGEILFSNNFRKFKMDFKALSEFEIKEISASTIDRDFERNRKIHKAWRIKKFGERE